MVKESFLKAIFKNAACFKIALEHQDYFFAI